MHTSNRSDRVTFIAIATACLVVLLAFEPFARPLMLDPATWDYMSVELARGLIPYRDVFLHKTPGAAVLGAFGARAASAIGIEPVHGAHAVFILLGALAPALLYTLCRMHGTRPLALASTLFFLAFDIWLLASIEGVRPKVATVTLGLVCLVAAARSRWTLAGVAGGAATLCWQPGFVFLLGAACSRDAEAGPRLRCARLAVGAGVVWLVFFAWMVRCNAIDAFVRDTIVFNLHYIEAGARAPWRTARRIAREFWHAEPALCVLFGIALLGLRRGAWAVPRSITVAGLSYLALAFASFQAWPDTLLLLPFVATTTAAGLSVLCNDRVAAGRLSFAWLPVVLAGVLVAQPSAPRLWPPLDFSSQRAAMRALASDLEPSADVIAVSVPEFLLHTNRRSRWPWPYLWFELDRFVAARTAGGFPAILADLEEKPPALILVARRWKGPLRRQFDAWAALRYVRTEARIYPHVRRPIAVYRLRESTG